MRTMFGVRVETLAVILSVLVGVCIAVVATLALRNVVFFRIGVRNIGRRAGRTVLIVVGLMLATAIIASALVSGDTMGRTVRSSVIDTLGSSDEWITPKGAQPPFGNVPGSSRGFQVFDERVATDVDRALRGSDLVDGVVPAIVAPVAVQDASSRQTEPRVTVFAPDPRRLGGFGAITGAGGRRVDLARLAPGSVLVNRAARDALDARTDDRLAVLVGGRVLSLRVAAIVSYRGAGTDSSAVLLPLRAAQQALGLEGKVTQILVSNRGGETSGLSRTDAVVARLRPVLAPRGLEAQPFKRDGLKTADDAGTAFIQMFSTFGSFSIAAGILLIFLIFVMLAAERRTEMGVARAIGTQRGHLVQTFVFEGATYDLVAAALGALLGVGVSLAMVTGMSRAFATESLSIVYTLKWPSIVVAYTLGVLLTFGVVAFSAWRVSVLNIVTAVRNLPDRSRRPRGRRGLVSAALVSTLGALLVVSGRGSSLAMPFMLGASLLIVGVVPVLRALRVRDRVSYTLAGAGLVVLWLLPFRAIETLVPGIQMDFSLWVVGGLLVVLGATWTVVYNADALLGILMTVFGRIRSLAAVLRISMAYPLRTRLRTGMTLSMFTLVVFTLVVGTTTSGAFIAAGNRVDEFGGGFDVRATTSAASPVVDMSTALRNTRRIDAREVRAVASESYVPVEARQPGTGAKYVDYAARGLDDAFLTQNRYALGSRARGYESDRAVWDAIRTRTDLAVVDPFIVPRRRNFSFGSFTDMRLSGFFAEDTAFDPVPVDVRDPETGRTTRFTVVGVLRDFVPREMAGISTSQRALASFGDRARPTMYFFDLAPGVDAKRFAKQLESAFLDHGLQAESFVKLVHDAVATSLVINRLIQGFMALGLIVGVAALGVIAARSVVERRQQIGVLRSIGFQAATVRLGFLLESGFLAVTSILVGAALGLVMSFNVVDDAGRQANYRGVAFGVPWMNLTFIFVVVTVVALATTYVPARRASRVYAAEALRYE